MKTVPVPTSADVISGMKPNSIAAQRPDLAAQMVTTGPDAADPSTTTIKSRVAIWWTESCDHPPYRLPPYARTRKEAAKSQCPGCKNARRSLAVEHPRLAAQAVTTGPNAWDPHTTAVKSSKPVWWDEQCGHGPYLLAPKNRTPERAAKSHCPGCRLDKRRTTSLAARHPQLALQAVTTGPNAWNPYTVGPKSIQPVWWNESCSHPAYLMTPAARTAKGAAESQCPRCKNGGPLTVTHPHLAAQAVTTGPNAWDPSATRRGSNRPVWWNEPCPHPVYLMSPQRRTAKGVAESQCPDCKSDKVQATSLAARYPELAEQAVTEGPHAWDPRATAPSSRELVWWNTPCPHPPFPMSPNTRTSKFAAESQCPQCFDGKRWTKQKIWALVKSLGDGIEAMTEPQLFAIMKQGGVLESRQSKFAMEVIQGKKKIEDILGTGSTVCGGVEPADPATDDTPTETSTPDNVEPVGQISASEDDIEFSDTVFDELGTFEPSEVEEVELPELRPSKVLEMSDEFLLVLDDEEVVNYLVAAEVANVWRSAYRLDSLEGEELEELKADLERFRTPAAGAYAERVRAQFITEYDNAEACVPPAGWAFRPVSDKIEQPNLMQRHVATMLMEKRRYGNWSKAGAGKTLSAVLASRLMDAGVSGINMVICPNNVIGSWVSAIEGAYPDSQIKTGTLAPTWTKGAGPRWLIVNYEKLPTGEGSVKALAQAGIDMLVVDEVHYSKHRAGEDASKRRQVLVGLVAEATEVNPNMALLAMSATPVVNDLHEARSLLELIEGVELNDVKVDSSINSAMSIHQRLVQHGTRWMPTYKMKLNEHRDLVDDIDVRHLVDDVRNFPGRPSPLDIDQMMLEPKLDYIVQRCLLGGRTLVYTEFVEGIVEPLRDALEAAGLKVGEFTGDDKTGLARFTGETAAGLKIRDKDRVDVLIGSSAVSTGIDGLQKVCSRIVFATLPWTDAQYTQAVARLWRTGQPADEVDVYIPLTHADLTNADGNIERWSWCHSRWARIVTKRTLADCAVDGRIPKGNLPDQKQIVKHHMDWLTRLSTSEPLEIKRRVLDGRLGDDIKKMTKTQKVTRFGELSKMNGAWGSAKSSTTHLHLSENPQEWNRYHELYRASRQSWDVVPALEFASWLGDRKEGRVVADLGCGEMLLADALGKSHEVLAFDHVAYDERVTACDISDLPVDDAAVDIAVLSLALMGLNHGDYLVEANRILPVDGQLWLCEPTNHLGTDEDRLRDVMRSYGFDLAAVIVKGQFTFLRAVKSPSDVWTEPLAIKLSNHDRALSA